MSEPLHVDLLALHRASSGVLDLMDSSRREHSLHDDELTQAASALGGRIGEALSYVATTWVEKRAALHTGVGHVGMAMADAVQLYSVTDQDSANSIENTASF